MRSLWAAGLLLRRLRSERGIILLIVALVAATSFVFAAAPRLVNRAADAGLRHALEVAPASQRNVAMRLDARLDPGDAAIGGLRDYGDRLAERIPASVAALVTERFLLVTTIRLVVPDPPSIETHLSLRYQEGLLAATRLVEGRWPVDLGMPLRQVPIGGDPDEPGGEPAEPAVFEVAFSAAQASVIGVGVGDRIPVELDPGDPLLRGTAFRVAPAEVEVVGIFEPIDAGAPYWSGDTALLTPDMRGDEDVPDRLRDGVRRARGVPEPVEQRAAVPLRVAIPGGPRADGRRPGGRAADGPAAAQPDRGGATGAPGIVVVQTGLGAILDRFVAERALAESVLSIAAIGPFALAAAALAMVAILLVRRRTATLALVRGRGASGALVLGTQLWEAIILAGGAALLGLAAAVALHPGSCEPALVDARARGRGHGDPAPRRRQLGDRAATPRPAGARRCARSCASRRGAS